MHFDLPTPRSARPEYRAALRTELEQVGGARRRRLRRWRPGVVVGLGLGITAAGGAAAAAFVRYQPVTNHTTAHCYSLPTEAGNNGTTVMNAGTPGTAAQVRDALAACSTLWRDGFLVSGDPRIVNVTQPTTVHPVPPLVVCTMADGRAAVFPGESGLCGRLGLPSARPPRSKAG